MNDTEDRDGRLCSLRHCVYCRYGNCGCACHKWRGSRPEHYELEPFLGAGVWKRLWLRLT